jgi:two-component system, response regulator PdtaR
VAIRARREEGVLVARSVVIAEDEAIVRLDLREILEEEGFEVVGEASRGDEAIELVHELHPDLVLLDIKMPGVDGLQAAEAISQIGGTAILFLTAFSQRDLVERARDAGAIAYLVKPFQRDELLPAIEVALGRFSELQALAAENASLSVDKQNLETQLETRRIVDRAKGKLMDEHGMSEAASFSFIQSRAMNDRVTMRAIATAVLEGKVSPALPA